MTQTRERWSSVLVAMIGATGLAYALQLSNGAWSQEAFRWLVATMTMTLVGVLALRLPVVESWASRAALVVAVGAGVVFFGIHLVTPPGVYLRVGGEAYVEHHKWVAAAAIAFGVCFGHHRWAFWGVLLSFVALGVWLLKASPNPAIDVFVWHQESYAALAKLQNPYALSIPNIYGHTTWYAQGTADNARVYVGYVYPPLSLLLGAPGHLLFHDYRYANLAALALTGGFIAFTKPSRLATVAAALFLFQPRMLFVLEQGWTEATALMMFAATLFTAVRFPRALPYVLGALLVTKQYFVLIAPLFLLVLPRPWKLVPFVLKAAVVGAVLTLPLALWDWAAFYKSVVQFQGLQPFRADALSVMAATAENGVPRVPMWASFAAALLALGLAAWRSPRTVGGVALSSALVYVFFFGVAKQAFCNYYFLVVGLLFLAVATLEPDRRAAPSRG